MKEGDYLYCYTMYNQIGGMGFRQTYWKVGKKYLVSISEFGELSVDNEGGWKTKIGTFTHDYLCTEQEYREKKLERILK